MVITLDKRKAPLGFCTERRARVLIEKGRACVYRYYPFTIIIKDKDVRTIEQPDEYRVKIDPGSKYTGIAVVREKTNEAMFFMQIEHHAEAIVKGLKDRTGIRKGRRSRETRYRPCKWINHILPDGSKYRAKSPRPKGWLPPSVKSIGDNVISWVNKLCRLINITSCSFEAVRFDTQLMDNPDIEGVEYQHGTLYGYEVKEYLLDKYGHNCQYCNGASGDKILEWEHIVPKSRGGSDSIKNATLACSKCNQAKGSLLLKDWLAQEEVIKNKKSGSKTRKELAEARVKGIKHVANNKGAQKSNRYCAWANSSRRYIEKGLFEIFGDVEYSSGGRTKYNRTELGLPKDHHYDALCVGVVPEEGFKDLTNGYFFYAKAMGRGKRLRGKLNKCGVIVKKWPGRSKRHFGFQTGDMVVANIPPGARSKYIGRHTGRVMTRATGSFDIRKTNGTLVTANQCYCKILQRDNGYQMTYKKN